MEGGHVGWILIEMRRNKRERKPERIAKICTCKHHTSTESNHEENTGFTLVLLEVQSPGRGNQDNQESSVKSGEDRKRNKSNIFQK